MSFRQRPDSGPKTGGNIDRAAAAVATLGYGSLAATTFEQPGLAPKVLAVGLGLKGVYDSHKALDDTEAPERIFAPELRARVRGRFDDLAATWRENPGKSLRDRLGRGVGESALSLEHKGFRNKFNALLGSIACTTAGGMVMLEPGVDGKAIAAGTVLAAAGFFGTGVYQSQTEELHAEINSPPSDMTNVPDSF